MAETTTTSSLISAAPAALSLLLNKDKGDRIGKPLISDLMTPQQMTLLGKLGGITGLSPQYTDTMRQMMYGGTAADYSPQASADLFNRDIIPHSTDALYNEQLPAMNQLMGSSYWSGLRGPETEKAQSASNLGLMSKLGESLLGNAQTGRSESETARESGLSALSGMQQTALAAQPYDLMWMPSSYTKAPLDKYFGKGWTSNWFTPGGIASGGWAGKGSIFNTFGKKR